VAADRVLWARRSAKGHLRGSSLELSGGMRLPLLVDFGVREAFKSLVLVGKAGVR
jgi:hypothetical protein